MSGHAGRRQGLLPDQQELRQRPPGAGTPLLRGQNDGGERSTVVGELFLIFILRLCHIYSKKVHIVGFSGTKLIERKLGSQSAL